MQKIVFASDLLPAELDDRARMAAWHESCAPVNSFDVSYLEGTRFFARSEFIHSDAVKVLQFNGTIARLHRACRHVVADRDDDFSLSFNIGRYAWALRQRDREAVLAPGTAILNSHGDTCDYRAATMGAFVGVAVPRESLASLVANVEELVNRPLDSGTTPMRHLRRYLQLVLGPDGVGSDAALDASIGRTLLDLVALALGADREAAELAQMRGLRAARLRVVLAEIKASFTDPACSAQRVGLKLGLSARTIQDLLQESGTSFTDRVLELRLQRARRLLTSADGDHLMIIEIASRCGFSEVSYFNRRFRARFGASPTQLRGRRTDAAD